MMRPIGSLLREACSLSEKQVSQVLAHQRTHGMRFGEAAVALRFVSQNDVLHALAEQFEYTNGYVGREVDSELVVAADPFSYQAEAFRELRSRLLLEVLGEDERRSALAVVSPDVGDGKTYLAANLAVAFSQLGARTLLIDADIRTPRLHRLFQVEHRVGLSSVLAGFAAPGEAIHRLPALPHLHFLPAGGLPPNPIELLQRRALRALIEEMLGEYEHVVLDTPAAMRGADSRIIAARCGAALVVARRNRSRLPMLEGLVDLLSRGPARMAGVVMNEH